MSSSGPRRRVPISQIVRKNVVDAYTPNKPEPPMVNEKTWGPAGMMTADEVDGAWQALLEETLPPDKQEALMDTYRDELDPRMRYNMLLEFSSYLRQGAGNASGGDAGPYNDPDDNKYARKKRPARRPASGSPYDEDEGDLCYEITRVVIIVAIILLCFVGGAFYFQGSISAASAIGVGEPSSDVVRPPDTTGVGGGARVLEDDED